MSLQAGSAYVEFVPKLAPGFGSKISEQVDPEAEKAGESGGSKWAKGFAAAGLAAGAVLAKGFFDSVDISAGTDKVAAQLGLTEGVAATAGKAASNLYKGAWGGSMEEVQGAISAVGSTLVDLNKTSQTELEKITSKALDVASAFDIDVNRATASAGILMKTGMAKDANEAFDLITVGLQNVPAQVREDLLDATDEYSTYFKNLGFNGSQAVKLLTDASAGGMIQIDKTGDAIKEFTIRATDMSTTSVEAYKAIGLDAKKMSDQVLAGGDTARGAFDKIIDGLLKIKDPTVQANTVIGLFGTQAEDIGVKNIPAFLQGLDKAGEGMGNVEGATQRMSDTLNGNAKTNIESFKRQALTGLTDFIGGTVIPKVTELSTTISTVLGDNTDKAKDVFVIALGLMATAMVIHGAIIVGGWVAQGTAATINAAKMVAGWVASAAAAVASGATTAAIYALYVAGWISTAASAVAGAATTVASWVATGASAVAAGIVATAQFALQIAKWALLGAASLAGAAQVAAAWLISMGPIVLVIAAVVGLVALVIANWDTIVEATKKAWNATWDKVKEVGTGIKNAATDFADFVKNLFLNWTGPGLIIKHFGDIKGAGEAAMNWIKEKVDWAVEKITGVFSGFKPSIDWGAIQSGFKSAINWIIDKWNAFELKIPEVDTHIPGVGKVGGFSIGTPDIPRLEKGGYIPARPGGILANIGEGRYDEVVLPLSPDILEALANSGGHKIEKHYHYHNESRLEDPLVDQFVKMERLALPV